MGNEVSDSLPLLLKFAKPLSTGGVDVRYDDARDLNVVEDESGVRVAVAGPEVGLLTKTVQVQHGED